MKKYTSHGFTLIELLVVISIIGILTALVTVNFLGVKQKGRDATRKSDLKQLQTALEFYRSDVGFYPSILANCSAGTALGNAPGCTTIYMSAIPKDPLSGAAYTYSAGGCAGTSCLTYQLTACLENQNDPDATNPTCAGAIKAYHVNNP